MLQELFLELSDQLEGQHQEDNSANNASCREVVDGIQEKPGPDDCQESYGNQRPDHLPGCVFPEKRENYDIADDEKRQNDADAVLRSEDLGDDQHVNDSKTREAGLGNTEAESAKASDRNCEPGYIEWNRHELSRIRAFLKGAIPDSQRGLR